MSRSLELRVPPVVVVLVIAALMAVVADRLSGVVFELPGGVYLAVLCVALGLALILSGVQRFRRAATTVDPRYPERSRELVVVGVYRVTRNPMYLGMLLVLAGLSVHLANPVTLLGLPIFVLYMNRFQILPEERALTAQFGEPYRDYCREVRRWL